MYGRRSVADVRKFWKKMVIAQDGNKHHNQKRGD